MNLSVGICRYVKKWVPCLYVSEKNSRPSTRAVAGVGGEGCSGGSNPVVIPGRRAAVPFRVFSRLGGMGDDRSRAPGWKST